MERKLEISRKNCNQGLWDIEDGEGRVKKVTPSKMIEHYISEAEGRLVSLNNLSQFSKLNMRFEPTDPSNIGRHDVQVKLTIEYEFRDPQE